MLINSKFRDFYDNCAAYGVDKSVTYRRVEENLYLPHREGGADGGNKFISPDPRLKLVLDACEGWGRPLREVSQYRSQGDADNVDVAVLGFCGILHRVVVHEAFGRWTLTGPEKEMHLYFDSTDMPASWEGKFTEWSTQSSLVDSFKEPISRENPEPFIALNAPVFIAYNNHVHINPNLRYHGFQKHKDGVTAFQEISAFISGTLHTANQMKHVASDQELIQAHGFDKHSFRKGKTK